MNDPQDEGIDIHNVGMEMIRPATLKELLLGRKDDDGS